MTLSRTILLLMAVVNFNCLLAQNSPAPIKLIDILLTPDQADWKYEVDQTATVMVTVLKNGVPVENARLQYEVGAEMLPADTKAELVLAKGTGKIEVGTLKRPGFRQLVVRTTANGQVYSGMVKLAFSPEKILPTVQMPPDFNAFWDTAKQSVANLPLDPAIILLPEQSTNTVNVYLVSLQNFKKGQRLFGYLCKPKRIGKYPVLFSPPGAGIKPMAPPVALAEQGFIVFSIEIHGISPLVDAETYRNISNAFGDYWLFKLDDPATYYYKSVYLGCARSIEFLCSLPEFDGKNVVVTGGSQGGALSIVTAALDKRVTCLAAFYPALSDITGYLHNRAGGWPHMLNARNPQNNTPAKLKTIGYYDVVNFARTIKVPGFYSWGYNDNTVPPTSVYAAVNVVTAPKTIVITPISGHWRFEETNQQSIEWIRKQLK